MATKAKTKKAPAKPAKNLRISKREADKVKGGLMNGPPSL